MNKARYITFLLILLICNNLKAQTQLQGYDFLSTLNSDINLGQIDFYIKNVNQNSTTGKYIYAINTNILNNTSKYYLNFKVKSTDSIGKIFEQTISIKIGNLNEGLNTDIINWELAGKPIGIPYEISKTINMLRPNLIQLGNLRPSDPDSLIILKKYYDNISNEQKVFLEIIGGDDLTKLKSSHWSWHVGGKNNTEIITTENKFNFSLTSTTTVYVYAVSNSTPTLKSRTISKTIVIDTNSYLPNRILTNNNPTCSLGDSTTLSIDGGNLGKNAKWFWYKNGCGEKGAEFIVSGKDEIKVMPEYNTTYFIRPEGLSVSSKACKELTINVVLPPAKPVIIDIENKVICEGKSIRLSFLSSENNIDGSHWEWYTKAINSNYSSITNNKTEKLNKTGTILELVPNNSAIYYVQSEGGICPSIKSETFESLVINKIQNIEISKTQMVDSKNYNLMVSSSILGKDSKWIWFEGESEYDLDIFKMTKIDEGNSIIVKPYKSKSKYIFLTSEGDCETPNIIKAKVSIPSLNTTSLHNKFNNKPQSIQKSTISSQLNFNIVIAPTEDKNLYTSAYTIGFYTPKTKHWSGYYFKYITTNLDKYSTNGLVADEFNNSITNFPTDGTYYKFNNNTVIFNSSSFLMGKLIGNKNTTLYTGIGYGEVQTIWGYDKYSMVTNGIISNGYAKNTTKSFTGISTEIGLMYRAGFLNFSAGLGAIFGKSQNTENSTQQNFINGHFGVGISILSRK